MFTSRNFRALLLLATSLLLLHTHAHAQSGRNPPTPGPVPVLQSAPAPKPADNTRYDKVRVVVSLGMDDFVKTLNEQGRLGYRLEKTFGYGDPIFPQRFAAVLHLDPGHRYEYVSDPVRDDARYGDPLRHHPSRGYTLARAYAVTDCRQVDVPDPNAPFSPSTRQETREFKGSLLLFMRRDATRTQTKEYKTFKGLFAPDAGQKKEVRAALNAAPQGFRPVGLLFSAAGSVLFNVSVVAERDLAEAAPPKIEYEVLKEWAGFEGEVNRLAAAGSRYLAGGRVESIMFALMERRPGDATDYVFVDAHRHGKEFAGTLAAGYSYAGLLEGESSCGSGDEAINQKLVFARNRGGEPAREYRVLELLGRKSGKVRGVLPEAAVSELQRLLAEGFRVRDIFYAGGLHAVLERPAAAALPLTQTSER